MTENNQVKFSYYVSSKLINTDFRFRKVTFLFLISFMKYYFYYLEKNFFKYTLKKSFSILLEQIILKFKSAQAIVYL